MSSNFILALIKFQHIRFFDSLFKDVMSVLGTPSSVYYKSEELNKLAINDNFSAAGKDGQQNDYFFNYITLGMVIYLYTNLI